MLRKISGCFVGDPELFWRETSESLQGDAGLFCGEYAGILREIQGSFANDTQLFRKRIGLVLLGLLLSFEGNVMVLCVYLHTFVCICISICISMHVYVCKYICIFECICI